MKEIIFPQITPGMINVLDKLYPDKCPGQFESLEDIRFKSGQRSVVNRLINEFKKQNNITE